MEKLIKKFKMIKKKSDKIKNNEKNLEIFKKIVEKINIY